jgi:hypothetical protein
MIRGMKRLYPVALLLLLASSAQASSKYASANTAFESYAASVEERLRLQHRSSITFIAGAGQSMAEPNQPVLEDAAGARRVEGGMIHHWRGSIFVPGATAAGFLRQQQSPETFAAIYAPQVLRGRLLSRAGESLEVALRLRYQKIIPVTFNSVYQVQYGQLDEHHGYSFSRSTSIAELAGAGSPQQRPVPAESGHGFLWRLNSYWSWQQEPGGLRLQCETVSLSRDIPTGMEWIVRPFLSSIPRESLEFTLLATAHALQTRSSHEN